MRECRLNNAALKIMNIPRAADVVGEPVVRILDPAVFLEVLNSGTSVRDQRRFLAEYKRYVELSVIYDHEYHLLICLMRDIT